MRPIAVKILFIFSSKIKRLERKAGTELDEGQKGDSPK